MKLLPRISTDCLLTDCQRPSRFWGLGCPKIYHEVEDTLGKKLGQCFHGASLLARQIELGAFIECQVPQVPRQSITMQHDMRMQVVTGNHEQALFVLAAIDPHDGGPLGLCMADMILGPGIQAPGGFLDMTLDAEGQYSVVAAAEVFLHLIEDEGEVIEARYCIQRPSRLPPRGRRQLQHDGAPVGCRVVTNLEATVLRRPDHMDLSMIDGELIGALFGGSIADGVSGKRNLPPPDRGAVVPLNDTLPLAMGVHWVDALYLGRCLGGKQPKYDRGEDVPLISHSSHHWICCCSRWRLHR